MSYVELARRYLGERFEVLELIGEGRFSLVFKVRDRKTGEVVALKIVKQVVDDILSGKIDPLRVPVSETVLYKRFLEEFLREVSNWADLTHPHIVKVKDWAIDPIPYIVLEYCGGGSLRRKLTRGQPSPYDIREAIEVQEPLPIAEVLYVGLCIAKALEYIHERGLVHRDVRPDNILFTEDGVPKLTDFGIARPFALHLSSSALEKSSGIIFTPYSAPEMLRGYYGPRSDIYMLGATLYEALTGQPPIIDLDKIGDPTVKPEKLSVLAPRKNRDPLVRSDPDLLKILDEVIVEKMLARDHRDRPSTREVVKMFSEIYEAVREPRKFVEHHILPLIDELLERVRMMERGESTW